MFPDGYQIRELAIEDAAGLADAYARNREYLAPWDPHREPDFYTTEGQAAAVSTQLTAISNGLLAGWLITHGGEIVGRVNLNNIVMGVLCSASVGYWVDERHQGRGLATIAVDFACAQALERGLHRVEAGTIVANQASQRVLVRCGFAMYGLAPEFLFIAGAWRDHRLYQRILHDRAL